MTIELAPPLRLSILMPVWNQQHFLSHCLETIQPPEDLSLEVVLVDDGSTDATRIIAEQWAAAAPFPVHIIHSTHRGKAAALNAAYAKAQGTTFIMLAGDDLLLSELLPSRVTAVMGPEPRLAQCGYLTFWDQSPEREGVEYSARGSGDHIAGGAASFNKAFAEIYFPIPEDLPNEDTWLRAVAIATETPIIPVEGIGLFYRIHPGNSVGPSRTFSETDQNLHQRHQAFNLACQRFSATLKPKGASRLATLAHAEKLRRRRSLLQLLMVRGLSRRDRATFIANASPVLYALKRRGVPVLRRLLRI